MAWLSPWELSCLIETARSLIPFVPGALLKGSHAPFVEREVLPALRGFPQTHETTRGLREDFWKWFGTARQDANIFADCGWPSEARFFIALVEDEFETRYLDGPFPLHDVATLLLAIGIDPHIDREQYAADRLIGRTGNRHDPWWDAYVSGQCAIKALKAVR